MKDDCHSHPADRAGDDRLGQADYVANRSAALAAFAPLGHANGDIFDVFLADRRRLAAPQLASLGILRVALRRYTLPLSLAIANRIKATRGDGGN